MAGTVLLLVLLSFWVGTLGQVPHLGDCPDRTPVRPVDPRKLTGTWYENQRSATLQEWPFKCIQIKLKAFFEKKSVAKVSAIHRFTGKEITGAVYLTSLDAEGRNGKMLANLTEMALTSKYRRDQIPLQVLATDANLTNWCIVWSCRPFPNLRVHTENIWILTHDREINDVTYKEIRDALNSLNLEHLMVRDTVQTGCNSTELSTNKMKLDKRKNRNKNKFQDLVDQ